MRWALLLIFVGCSSSDPVVMDASAPVDAGPPDSGVFDLGAPDLGPMDTGLFDNGVLDMGQVDAGGVLGCIVVSPPTVLEFPAEAPREGMLSITNICDAPLTVTGLNIRGPGGDPSHPSIDDFELVRCSTTPCAPALLCDRNTPSCSTLELFMAYTTDDITTTGAAELSILTDDPGAPEYVVELSAPSLACPPPTAAITVQTFPLCRRETTIVDALLSDPGGLPPDGSSIVNYQWSWGLTPGPPPAFMPPSAVETSFVPEEDGIHVLQLVVTNACGARSEPKVESLVVQMECE